MLRRPEIRGLNRRLIGAGGAIFNPASFGTVLAYWDPTDLSTITKDGSDLVGTMAAKIGGSSWDVTQATGAKKPLWHATNGKNGRPCLIWTGASATFLATAGTPASNQPTTLVSQLYSSNAAALTFSDAKNTPHFRRYYGSATQMAAAAGAAIAVNYSLNVWGNAAAVYNGVSGAVRWNGTTTSGNIGAVNGAGIVFGGLQDDTNHSTFRSGKIILYTGALSGAALTALFAALDAA